jgi:hypothetical protein
MLANCIAGLLPLTRRSVGCFTSVPRWRLDLAPRLRYPINDTGIQVPGCFFPLTVSRDFMTPEWTGVRQGFRRARFCAAPVTWTVRSMIDETGHLRTRRRGPYELWQPKLRADYLVSSRVGWLSLLIVAVDVFGCDGNLNVSTLFEPHIITIFVS